jgi:hypothetical protein
MDLVRHRVERVATRIAEELPSSEGLEPGKAKNRPV